MQAHTTQLQQSVQSEVAAARDQEQRAFSAKLTSLARELERTRKEADEARAAAAAAGGGGGGGGRSETGIECEGQELRRALEEAKARAEGLDEQVRQAEGDLLKVQAAADEAVRRAAAAGEQAEDLREQERLLRSRAENADKQVLGLFFLCVGF